MIALVRSISPRFAECELTHLSRSPIDLTLAVRQHAAYLKALENAGCDLEILSPLPDCPDGVFVEDMAIALPELAIISRPGAISRRTEVDSVQESISHHRKIKVIEAPGTLDGGDVLWINKNIWVGLSSRTNQSGFEQLHDHLVPLGYHVRAITNTACLHLKSAVSKIGPNQVLLSPAWIEPKHFSTLEVVETDPNEPDAANALLVNTHLIYPSNFPKTAEKISELGYHLQLIDNSEVIKAEGGVTCGCILL